MNILKLGFTDTFSGAIQFFTDILSQRYEIVRDDVSPDYLIFSDRNFGNNNVNYKDCIKIFYTGENQRPSDYQCNYALSFDHTDDDRHFRFPLYVIYEYDHHILKNRAERKLSDIADKKFCSFVVKNPGCDRRNAYYHTLNSQYKQVDSAGPLFNNMNGWRPDSVVSKVEFMSKYKFNLCFENSSYPGYCTEKLFEASCATTIPIYWGSPTAALDFNPKAFLNWHDYNDDQEFINAIIRLDNDPEAYAEMYMQPMFLDNKPNRYFDTNRFLDWFDRNVYKGVK
jgi:hypothetical protein